jgi:hypothetical protein
MLQGAKRVVIAGAAFAALALGGSAIAGAAGSAQSTTAATPQSGSTPSSSSRPAFPAHGTAAHEDAEKPVTGSAASKAQAAAIKSAGGGTAGAVTTDMTGNGYEVTVTKSDGSKVEVHMDSSFNVMQGGPRGGAGYGPPPGG